MAPAGGEAPEVELILGGEIARFVRNNKLGKVTGAEGGYWLSPGDLCAPDIAFYTFEKHKLHTNPDEYRPFPPELAVEIVSPTDKASSIRDKVRRPLQAGVRLVWVVYPDTREIVAHYPDGAARAFAATDTLDGGDVLPGFALRVAEAFPPDEDIRP